MLSDADIFVLPSLAEARPRSIIEAMSLGVPVVASDVGGIPSLVDHDETGLLVPAGDAVGLALAIDRLVQSPDLRARLAAAARAYAETRMPCRSNGKRYVGLYRRLVAERPGAQSRRPVLGAGA